VYDVPSPPEKNRCLETMDRRRWRQAVVRGYRLLSRDDGPSSPETDRRLATTSWRSERQTVVGIQRSIVAGGGAISATTFQIRWRKTAIARYRPSSRDTDRNRHTESPQGGILLAQGVSPGNQGPGSFVPRGKFLIFLSRSSTMESMTGEELYRRPDLESCELIDGMVVPLAPTKPEHGETELDLGYELRAWVRSSGRGRVLSGDVGIYIRRSPDTVRAPDVMFISHERYAQRQKGAYLTVAPELVVEVLSPEDRPGAVWEKLADYFSAGVDRVWVVDLKEQRISAYRSLTDVQQLGIGDALTDEELLPGFRLSLSELFDS
jgi:Uma2 family endonuclease